MPSEGGKAVAQEVIREVGRGRIPNKMKIAVSKGYSLESARTGKPQQTKAYKQTVGSFVQKMEAERERIITALAKKELGKERYKDLTDSLDKLTKNIQLLSGRATENIATRNVHISEDKRALADQALASYIDEDPQGDSE